MNVSLALILCGLVICIGAIVLMNRFLKLHAFFCLLLAGLLLGLITGKSLQETITAMQTGFGSLLQQIGFIVALGSCLGIILEKTGAMETISHKMIYAFGAKRSVMAMSVIGFVVGIPVFCDSGFIILSRLIPSIAAQASVPGASLALSLSTALYTTHTLVPPTPGPLAAAANFGLSGNLGETILIGLIGSIPVMVISFVFAKKLGRSITLTEISQERKNIQLPSAIKAFLPLVVPIVLITIATVPKTFGLTGFINDLLSVAGQPVVALMIGLALAFTLIPWTEKTNWPLWLTEALKDAGVILLITGAGGAFGYVIKNTGIDLILKTYITSIEASGIIFLIAGYLIAAILKTAQGSTTSSMIITSSLLAPLTFSAGFESTASLAMLVLAIGGGAMTVSHANDSYFWVVSQFGGLNARDTLRSFTLITLIQGFTALVTSIVLFLIW
jgi:GntP family gluconate:H+ symporter